MALQPPLLTERVDDEWGGLVLPRLRSVCLSANSSAALNQPAYFVALDIGCAPGVASPPVLWHWRWPALNGVLVARRGLGAGRFVVGYA